MKGQMLWTKSSMWQSVSRNLLASKLEICGTRPFHAISDTFFSDTLASSVLNIVLAIFPYMKRKDMHVVSSFLCLSVPLITLNQLIDIHETCYEHHVTRGHSTSVLLNYLPSIIPAWWLCKLLTWAQH